MNDQRRLEWVQRNRARSKSTHLLGGRMEQVVQRSIDDSGVAAARSIAEKMQLLVDEDFRDHCKVAVAANGHVTVVVDHPSRVYAMRSRWLAPLAQGLSLTSRSGTGDRIRFEYGSHGVAL